MKYSINLGVMAATLAVTFTAGAAQSGANQKQQMMTQMAQQAEAMAPWQGYLKAHADVRNPLPLLGGPLKISVKQSSGGVFAGLPDLRKLDPDVFGSTDHPRAFGGFPGAEGVPVPMRKHGKFGNPSPFGDKYVVLRDGRLTLSAVDATATDAATTKDSLKLDASWKDKQGNTYEVKCCKMLASHGVDYPTFGGVASNIILHGSSRIGTPLMPSEYTYVDFWGMGMVLKNGKVLQAPRLIHGMLTEYVRTSGYKLGFDKDVTPARLHFHLMVPPVMPEMSKGTYKMEPVNTGFKLPNGMTLPFWHVMFENLTVTASRSESSQQFWPPESR